ncbi:FAD-binding protein [Candidatus Woesearchaeota archaeon]|nr:FAD-binding protein [Candidatus Woesearchaeota archaeon]
MHGLYDVLIIGSGIAGSVLAFELEKKHIKYLVCTEQKTLLSNTSSMSFGHCRVPKNKELDDIIEKSTTQLGEDEKRMRFIYSRADLVLSLFKELEINFEHRSFGVIPSGRKKGGRMILEKLQQHISSFETEANLMDFAKSNDLFDVYFIKKDRDIKLRARYLVLATGGYAGTFEYTNNFRYKSYNIFDIVRKNGSEIINTDCIFIHPFGYNEGRKILIGNETREGEFIDSEGNFVFDKETRDLVRNNKYHEIFDQLLRQITAYMKRGSEVYFAGTDGKIKITPTAHYTAGGIKTDNLGEATGCKDLFAIGECKADGSRNGGRFPGYPFTSSIVCGKVLADYFKKTLNNKPCK